MREQRHKILLKIANAKQKKFEVAVSGGLTDGKDSF